MASGAALCSHRLTPLAEVIEGAGIGIHVIRKDPRRRWVGELEADALFRKVRGYYMPW